MFQHLQSVSKHGKLPKRAISESAQKFNASSSTVSRVWHRRKEGRSGLPANVNWRKIGFIGRKKIFFDINNCLQNIPLKKRKLLRSVAAELQVSKSSLQRRFKNDKFWVLLHRKHYWGIKTNLQELVLFCQTLICPPRLSILILCIKMFTWIKNSLTWLNQVGNFIYHTMKKTRWELWKAKTSLPKSCSFVLLHCCNSTAIEINDLMENPEYGPLLLENRLIETAKTETEVREL